ncbi:MAG: YdeI/OmpD-associated family protein [Phycisphaerales bacterium]
MPTPKTVDEYIACKDEWHDELVKLRKILTATEMEETVKWGAPCYTVGGKNVVGLAAFKGYVGLWFHQGALLSDPDKALVNAQDGKTKALRQWRFESSKEIKVARVKAYVKEAIELQKAGKEIKADRNKKTVVPPELAAALKKSAPAKRAFDALTPGKQREYCAHVADAKRAETKQSRVEKIVPMIKAGKGLYDKYKNC